MDIEEELDAFHLENGFDRQPDGRFIEIPPYSPAEAKAAAAARAAAARAQWCRNAGVEPAESETTKAPSKATKPLRATGDSHRTRERIRAAAERLFQERGFES